MELYDLRGTGATLPESLIDWYWQHGSKRTGQYQLSRSGFLSPLHDFRDQLQTAPSSDSESRRVIGLWGPSQVGKSTLLSMFLDLEADGMGRGSILQWSESEPVRFEKSQAHPDERPLSLNPYNFKADASACISRFQLVSSVPDNRFPVEVKLAKTAQMLHSLALGYLYDWQRDDVRDLKRASEVLSSLIDSATRVRAPDRRGFDLAESAASVLRLLRSSQLKHQRYQSLTNDLIDRFLDSNLAVDNQEQVAKAVGEVFWDGERDVSNLFSDLLKTIRFYTGENQRIFCSYEVAALLVDMQSYLRAEGGTTFDGDHIEPDDVLASRIMRICRSVDDDGNVFLGIGNGNPAFSDLVSYAVFQAAAWELVIPINEPRLRAKAQDPGSLAATFQSLLSLADILDFPGVSNIGRGGNDRISSTVIAKRGAHLLFSHLVKRGKTSAMVSSSASTSHVDGFCLLLRNQGAFANPDVINDGIRTWQRELGRDATPLLNVVVTFFGDLIKDSILNPEKTSFKGAFNNLEALATEFVDRENVFPVCFHKYESLIPNTVWESSSDTPELDVLINDIQEAAGRLSKDKDYLRWFGGGADRIIEAALSNTGGIPPVVERLISQVKRINKTKYFEGRREQLEASIKRLLEMALPGEASEMERKRHLIEKISQEITKRTRVNGRYAANYGKRVSCAVRSLVTIIESELDPVPLRVARSSESGRKYLEEQLNKWSARQSKPHPDLGLRDPSDAANLTSYMIDAVSIESTLDWLTKNFGTIVRPNAAQDACRYLSVRITGQLLPRDLQSPNAGSASKSPPPLAEAIVKEMADAERGERSDESTCPHYRGVVAPFLSHLKMLAERRTGERPPQEGDAELLKIVKNIHS